MLNIVIFFLFLGSAFYVQVGPKGIEFARYSLDYHTIRNYLYVNRLWGKERYVRSFIYDQLHFDAKVWFVYIVET